MQIWKVSYNIPEMMESVSLYAWGMIILFLFCCCFISNYIKTSLLFLHFMHFFILQYKDARHLIHTYLTLQAMNEVRYFRFHVKCTSRYSKVYTKEKKSFMYAFDSILSYSNTIFIIIMIINFIEVVPRNNKSA